MHAHVQSSQFFDLKYSERSDYIVHSDSLFKNFYVNSNLR